MDEEVQGDGSGENFLIQSEDGVEKFGFYTTRWVEAPDEEGAEKAAIAILRKDHHLLTHVQNDKSDPPMMYVVEIQELRSFGKKRPPGSGFTFYSED